MAKLSVRDIEQIATLARLKLSDEEKERYADQLSVVFEYMDILQEVETNDVPETCQVTGLEDVVRQDKATPCDEETRQKLIDAFPERVGNLLKVPAVFSDNLESSN